MANQHDRFAVLVGVLVGIWGCDGMSLTPHPATYESLVRMPKVMHVLDLAHLSDHSPQDSAPSASDRPSDVTVTDVVDVASGQSVMGEDAPLSLHGDMAGKQTILRILGSGFTWPEHFADIAKRYTVTTPTDFFAATFVGQQPYSVLLSDTIALQPVEGGVFSATELTMSLDTRALVDLQISGAHTLTVTAGNQRAQVPIRFGPPSNKSGLAPAIKSVEVVDAQDDDAWLLEINGTNLPLDYRKVWVHLNGKTRLYYHATFISEQGSIGYVHVPKDALLGVGENTLMLADPFGVAMASF